MPAESEHPPTRTTGTIRIVRQTRAGDPSRAYDFLVSFGSAKDRLGAFYLGKAFGSDDLIRLLSKIGVSQRAIDAVLELLKEEPHHDILNVTISKGFLRTLGS